MSIRVSSGAFKGKKIYTPLKETVRPTKSIVKEAIIEILKPLENKKILDLFAGYGTVGLEALSRSAEHVTFVEKNKKVLYVLKKNLNEIAIGCNYDIVNEGANKFLMYNQNKYDIIFADPPYRTYAFNDLQPLVEEHLLYGGIFCMEIHKKSKLDFSNIDIRKYGQTKVVFWTKK
tara:strand:+ start:614 stop:1138 length:525 start_codon:yes stop_codon:yes gene_type:complete